MKLFTLPARFLDFEIKALSVYFKFRIFLNVEKAEK